MNINPASIEAELVNFRNELSYNPVYAKYIPRLDAFIAMVRVAREQPVQGAPPPTPVAAPSVLADRIEYQRLENYQQDFKLMVLKEAGLQFKNSAREETQVLTENALRAETFRAHAERGLALQRIRVEKEKEKGMKLQNEIVRYEVDMLKEKIISMRLKEKEARLLELEEKVPRAEAALKRVEVEVNTKTKELHRKQPAARPLKQYQKRETETERNKREAEKAGVLAPEGPLTVSMKEAVMQAE